jgi:hypothetical protein
VLRITTNTVFFYSVPRRHLTSRKETENSYISICHQKLTLPTVLMMTKIFNQGCTIQHMAGLNGVLAINKITELQKYNQYHKYFYNIAFVNSERWLAKSRVDITQCQHGNVGKFLSLCFFVLYYKTNINCFRVDIHINIVSVLILVQIGKTRNFSFSQFALVLI